MSAIYMISTNTASVLANGVVPLNVAKRNNSVIMPGSNAAILKKPGYYGVYATVTFSAPEAGNISLAIQKNGVTVPGITAVETITTPDTEFRTVTIQGIVQVLCHEDTPALTLVNTSDAGITVTNASLVVIY